MFFGKLAQHLKVLVQLTDEVFLRSPLITVNTYQSDTVVTRIAFQVFLIGQVGSHSR